jgi:outer membrane beta-barrel protein
MKLLLSLLILTTTALAEDLKKELENLNVPNDRVTPLLSEDQLYVVNERYSSLTNRHELSMQLGNNFTAPSHMISTQRGLSYRYHLNPKWSFGARYVQINNQLSDSGQQLLQLNELVPDTDYATDSMDIFASFNTTYGKLRIGSNQVVYFDQYIALGAGTINMGNGTERMLNLDVGFDFWIGKNYSLRLGIKNEFFEYTKLSGARANRYNAQGYLGFGYLFGSGDRI